VVDLHAAFDQQLFNVTVGGVVAQVPPHPDHDHLGQQPEPGERRSRRYHGAGTGRVLHASSMPPSCPSPTQQPEYALANTVTHPVNVYLRERDLIAPLDVALERAFAPHRLHDTITAMTDSQNDDQDVGVQDQAAAQARARLADCVTKLARHRAALEAGADPQIVTGWIADVQAERQALLAELDQTTDVPPPAPPARMTSQQIADLVRSLGDIVRALHDADPADRAEVYRQLGLKLTYHPKNAKSASRPSQTRISMG
jgi:hypothetical protein